MTYDEVLYGPSDIQKILDFIEDLESEHPYKIYGDADSYSDYNQGWCDAIDRVRSYVESL